jgi:peptidoglycan/xylan/chitin deacetylase (PgdA/CDA1 family)/glycosyltransferase involved in cell wall biosynthesis
MRVGIGVLSYNRPASLRKCLDSLFENLALEARVAVNFDLWNSEFEAIAAHYPIDAINGPSRGIACANNRLMQFFDGYDALFLVQDDVRFLRPEWLEEYLRGLRAVPYLAFFDPYYPQDPDRPRHFKVNYFKQRRRVVRDGVKFWLCHKSPQGAFQAIGRECMERVGHFDTGFGQYGIEHHDYWLRVCNAGLCPAEHFYDIERSPELLSIDWAQPPSLNVEEREAASHRSKSWRRKLFVESDLGFRRAWVVAPHSGIHVLRRGADDAETHLPEQMVSDWLAKPLWVYPARIPVLAYHAVSGVPGDRYAVPCAAFKRHMALLTEHFRFVTVSQAYATWRENGRFPQDLALLTFDDGYQDFLSITPLLEELNVKATIFVLAGWVGRENTWDRAAFTRRKHLSWAELSELIAAGHELGSHTLDHYRLTLLPAREAAREVMGSKAMLEDRLGQPVRTIAYPFGSVDAGVISTVRDIYDVGFVAGGGGVFDWGEEIYAIPRITVDAQDDAYGLLSRIADYMMQAPWSESVWRPCARK